MVEPGSTAVTGNTWSTLNGRLLTCLTYEPHDLPTVSTQYGAAKHHFNRVAVIRGLQYSVQPAGRAHVVILSKLVQVGGFDMTRTRAMTTTTIAYPKAINRWQSTRG